MKSMREVWDEAYTTAVEDGKAGEEAVSLANAAVEDATASAIEAAMNQMEDR